MSCQLYYSVYMFHVCYKSNFGNYWTAQKLPFWEISGNLLATQLLTGNYRQYNSFRAGQRFPKLIMFQLWQFEQPQDGVQSYQF